MTTLGWIFEAAALLAVVVLLATRLRRRPRIVGTRRGLGAEVVVRQVAGHRELWLVDGAEATLQSRSVLADPLVSGIAYTDGFHLYPPAGGDVLFIGAGAAVAPRQFVELYPDVRVHIFEHDPAVVAVAARHFGLSPSPRLQIVIADGRAALERSGSWAQIVVDAFGAGDFPSRLATFEAFRACREHLAPGGKLAVNLAGTLAGPTLRAVRAGIVAAFGAERTLAFGVPSLDSDPSFDPRRPGNAVVFAFRDGVPDEAPGARVPESARPRLRFLGAIAALRLGVEADAEPLHDATAPASLPIA